MIVFTGVAGSGKSVQGKMLADELGYPWLSTGEFLRMLVSGEERIRMAHGELLDDKLIIGLTHRIFSLIDTKNEFILDGFPRSLAQADWLINQMKHGQLEITAVINLTASEAVVEERLLQRGRTDDTKEAIQRRFTEYQEAILPILEDFRKAGVTVHDIEAEQDPKGVYQAIKKALA